MSDNPLSSPGNNYVGAAAQFGTGLLDSFYNIWSGNRAYHAQQRQQTFMNDLSKDELYNSMQIRARDLSAAGLHPTLAAGGAGAQTTAGSASSPPMPSLDTKGAGGILQNRLVNEQLNNIRAQTQESQARANLTNVEASLAPEKFGLDRDRYGNEVNRTNIDARRLALDVSNSPHIMANYDAQARASRARAFVDALEAKYMDKHNMHMPQRAQTIAEISALFSRYFPKVQQKAGTVAHIFDSLFPSDDQFEHAGSAIYRGTKKAFMKAYEKGSEYYDTGRRLWRTRFGFFPDR